MVCHILILGTICGVVNRVLGAAYLVSCETAKRIAYRGDPQKTAFVEGIYYRGRRVSNGSRG